MRRDEVTRGFWLASALGFPILNAALFYGVGTARHWASLPWPLAAVLVVELAMLGTRLRARSRADAGSVLVLAALAIAADTIVMVFVGYLPYVLVLCSTRTCFG
jgi:cytochrome bd-type quinol oxidase subunit 2